MDKRTARHALAMCNKIKMHAQSMANSVDFSESSTKDFQYVPVERMIDKFKELQDYWHNIELVITDMEPTLLELDGESKEGHSNGQGEGPIII